MRFRSLFLVFLGITGLLASPPVFAQTAATSGATGLPPPVTVQPLTLNVDIPGLRLASGIAEGSCTDASGSTTRCLQVPFLAQYVAAVANYLMGITLIAAAVMIVWGGFKYVLSSSIQSVKDGKDIIKDAVIGLLLAFSVFTILRTLNPATLDLKAVNVPFIKQETIEFAVRSVAPIDTTNPTFTGKGSDPVVVEDIIKGAKAAGTNPCVMLAISQHETHMTPDMWNGKPAGTTKEQAGYFGVAGTGVGYLEAFRTQLEKIAPDFPPKGSTKLEKADWLTKNGFNGAAYGGLMVNANRSIYKGNEMVTLAAYAAGAGSITRYFKAMGCSTTPNYTFKDAATEMRTGKSIDEILKKNCLTDDYAAIPGLNYASDCSKFNNICGPPIKVNTRAEFEGSCGGDLCIGMKVNDLTRYVLSHYNEMVARYKCED